MSAIIEKQIQVTVKADTRQAQNDIQCAVKSLEGKMPYNWPMFAHLPFKVLIDFSRVAAFKLAVFECNACILRECAIDPPDPTKKTVFYRRSGSHASRKSVRQSRLALAEAKRTGKHPNGLAYTIQPTVAVAFEHMTDEEFCDWSGAFTYKRVVK